MTDKEALERIKNGDQDALAWVYTACRPKFVFWFMGKRGLSLEDATDLYHDTILVFRDNALNGKLPAMTSKISTYLIEVGKNKMYEADRKETRWMKVFKALLADMPLAQNPWPEYDLEAWLNAMEQQLKALGEPCKTLLELYYIEGKTYKEIIRIVPNYSTEEVAKARKYKCLGRLRRLIFQTYKPDDL